MSTPSYVKDIVEQHLKTFSWSAEITAAAPALTAHPTESEELPMPTQSTPELDEAKPAALARTPLRKNQSTNIL